MMQLRLLARIRWGIIVALLAGLGYVPASAQGPENDALDQIERESDDHRTLLRDLLTGKVKANPMDPKHVAALDNEAKMVTYRFYYPEYHHPADSTKGRTKSIEYLFGLFVDDVDLILAIKDEATRNAIAQMFTEKVAFRAGEVLISSKNIARINAARVLATLARLRQPLLVTTLIPPIEDNDQIEAVKYWVFRALSNLMNPRLGPVTLTKEQRAQAAKALVAFIDREVPFLPTVPRAEVEGYHILRREAIRALAATGVPSTDKDKPAMLLLRIASGQKFAPELRFDEQIEGAIGLARVNPALDPDYNAEYAAMHMAYFLDRFAGFCLTDNRTQRFPCKIYAAKLIEALQAMDAASKNAYVTDIVKTAVPILTRAEQATLRPADSAPLVDKARNAPPTANQLFKSDSTTTVMPPGSE